IQISIKLFGLRVQVAIVAGKRNGVLGPDCPRKVCELGAVLIRVIYVGAAPIDDLETQPGVRGAMATQYEIDFRVAPQDLLEREAHGLAVVGVQDGLSAGLDHQNRIGEVPKLITGNLKVSADPVGFAMDQLRD